MIFTQAMFSLLLPLLISLNVAAAAEDAAFQWAGLFQMTAEESPYLFTLKMPSEASDVGHEGHAHRRGLQSSNTDDHWATIEYSFFMALVPVTEEGQAGIDQAVNLWEAAGGSITGVAAAAEAVDDHSGHDHARRWLQEQDITIVSVENGTAITPSTNTLYELFFSDEDTVSMFPMELDSTQRMVLFLPANPYQVEGPSAHYLVNAQGEDVWPETEQVLEPSSSDKPKPWGTVIGATLLINIVTLVGVVFLVPIMTKAVQNKTFSQVFRDMISSTKVDIVPFADSRRHILFTMALTSFACGALLATTVFLIVPEAILLVNDSGGGEGEDAHAGHDDHRFLQDEDGHEGHDHGNKNWVFGTCVLAGFLFPWIIASFFPHTHFDDPEYTPTKTNRQLPESSNKEKEEDCEEVAEDDHENLQKIETDDEEAPEINKRLVSAIILGDALHNFADGVFVGVGFLLCDNTVGWSILASTIYHELAQELSDFFLLSQHCHLPPLVALLLNFCSGLSVTLGGMVVLATDISNFSIGILLSMSSGLYIHVAAKECMPIVDRLAVSLSDKALALLAFAFGAIPIGLVLLNHEHCEG